MDRWHERLPGRAVRAVDTHGKHLFLRFDGGLTLHSHLRMGGWWGVYRRGERWRRCPRRAWLVIRTPDHEVVQFDGPVLELMTDGAHSLRPAHRRARPRHRSPTDFDEREFLRRLREDDQTRGIGDALLDQRNLAGIGNIWKSEGCFLAGLDPWRRVSDVSDDEALAVVAAIQPLMRGVGRRAAGPAREALGLRARGPALPALRHADPRARPGRRQPHDLLVPGVPALMPRRPQGRRPRRARQHDRELPGRARARRGHDRVRRAAAARRPARAGPRLRGRRRARAA